MGDDHLESAIPPPFASIAEYQQQRDLILTREMPHKLFWCESNGQVDPIAFTILLNIVMVDQLDLTPTISPLTDRLHGALLCLLTNCVHVCYQWDL